MKMDGFDVIPLCWTDLERAFAAEPIHIPEAKISLSEDGFIGIPKSPCWRGVVELLARWHTIYCMYYIDLYH